MGQLIHKMGAKYNGSFKDGKKDGNGTMIFANGNKYIGAWKEDKMHGVGIFFCGRENSKRQGQWKEGRRIMWLGQATKGESQF